MRSIRECSSPPGGPGRDKTGDIWRPRSRSSGDVAGVVMLELIGLGIWIAAIVQLGVLRGTRGNNYYGEDPLGVRPD